MRDDRLATALWRGKWLVALSLTVSVVLAVLATVTSDKVYEGRVLLRLNTASAGADSNAFDAQQASQSFVNTYATMLGSRSFLDRVAEDIGNGKYAPGDLRGMINAEAVADTSLISLSAQAPSPAEARVVVDDVARQFTRALKEDSRTLIDEQQRAIEDRIAAVNKQIEEAQREDAGNTELIASLRQARSALNEQLAGALSANLARTVDVTLAGPSSAPDAPVSPRPMLNLIAGLMLGGLIGVALAWLRMRVDTKVRSGEEAEQLTNLPVFGSLPLRRGRPAADRPLRNAYDLLHANLFPTGRNEKVTILVVTSAEPGDGKSSVARGLAEAAALAGTDVLLIDGDLRQRQLSRELEAQDRPGLSDAIFDVNDPIVMPASGSLPFRFLPAGLTVSNPSALFRSSEASELMDHLRETNDLVIIDTPPGAAVPDASILAGLADAVVVVVRAGKTGRSHLKDFVAALDRRLVAQLLGLVALEPRPDPLEYPEPAGEDWRERVRRPALRA